jgi:hypothetical protein
MPEKYDSRVIFLKKSNLNQTVGRTDREYYLPWLHKLGTAPRFYRSEAPAGGDMTCKPLVTVMAKARLSDFSLTAV